MSQAACEPTAARTVTGAAITGAGWRTAAGAVAAVVLGCGGCSSPSVDPAVSVDPIERLGRRAVQPEASAGGGAAGPEGAQAGERRAPARTPSVDPVMSKHSPAPSPTRSATPSLTDPAAHSPPHPATRSATSGRAARPSRTPALRAPVLAESATRLLDRIHGPQRPPKTPGSPPERHAPR
ncbi:hypothetical protein [Streptomyces sp. NPDC047315]|uniref:hypothetical protein n=1 Tax=Streptomyces sp. NPDC047315 TaxID=3155142 RepID=UPI0033FBFE35